MSESWTIGRVIEWAAKDLRDRGFDSPRLDAGLLLAEVLGCDRIKLIVDSKRPLAPEELAAYKALHKRRRQGEPVSYMMGEREFYGRTFFVDRRVMVPRPETEMLVEVALRRTSHLSLCARVLDLCTGSGCVAITLKKERPTTGVLASDVSADALEVAALNALRIGATVPMVQSNLYEDLQRLAGRLDLITANPPYIARDDADELPVDVRDFEPPLALFADEGGVSVIRRIVEGAPAMLGPGGVLAIEMGFGQAERVRAMFEGGGFSRIEVTRDYAGIERVVSGSLE